MQISKSIKISLIVVILFAILGIIYNNYNDRKNSEMKNNESKNRLLYGAKEKSEEEKSQESKNRLLHGSSN